MESEKDEKTDMIAEQVGDLELDRTDLNKADTIRHAITFVNESRKRELAKMSTLGPYDPTKDKRSMAREAMEECYDILSYMRFLERKHPDLREEVIHVKKLAFEVYRVLVYLEDKELRYNRVLKGGGIESN